MAQFDGIGRVYHTDLNPQVSRSPKTDPTEKDRKRREKEEKHDDKHEEEPHDSVELHEETSENLPQGHEPKPELVDEDEDGLDISA